MAVTSFFGFNNKTSNVTAPDNLVTTEVINSPTPEVVTPTVKLFIAQKPTLVPRPKSSINEAVLKKFFGISDNKTISWILNSTEEIKKYELEFYAKFKKFPMPRVDINNERILIAMPGKDGTAVICTGEQLKNLYTEAEGYEKQTIFSQMDSDCHYNKSKQETMECQEWRKVNDNNRVISPPGSLDEKIAAYSSKINEIQRYYDNLLVKYCK